MTEENVHTSEPSFFVDTGKHKGLMAWLTTTDHKRIGLMYMYAIMIFFYCRRFAWRIVAAGTFPYR